MPWLSVFFWGGPGEGSALPGEGLDSPGANRGAAAGVGGFGGGVGVADLKHAGLAASLCSAISLSD